MDDVLCMSEASDTAEIGCCSVCSRMQTNKGRAAEELAKTAAATAQRRAAEELAKSAATLTLPSKMLPMLFLRITKEDAVFANRRGD